MERQQSFFDNNLFNIDKPIRLITLFSGYDSQALALKYLGVPFEHYRTCEWAVKSIQALHDLHFDTDTIDYAKDLTQAQLVEYLSNKGISMDYKKPMTKEQISRKPLEHIQNDESVSPCLTARGGGEEHSGMVLFSETARTIRVNGRGNLDAKHTWDIVIEQGKTIEKQIDIPHGRHWNGYELAQSYNGGKE